jgi:hypothetical protein
LQSWLDNFKRLNGLDNNSGAPGVTSHRPRKLAQKRLGKLLATSRTDLVLLNLGIKAPKVRKPVPLIPSLAARRRRDPRSTY